MTKDFLIGFLSCSCLYLLMALTPVSNSFKKEQQVFNELANLYQNVQPRQYAVFTTTPTFEKLREREVVMISTGTISLLTRFGSSTYTVTLNK